MVEGQPGRSERAGLVGNYRLGITARSAIVLLVLVTCMSAMAATGVFGLRSARRSLDTLYEQNVLKTHEATDLIAHLDDAEQIVLRILVSNDRAGRRSLEADLESNFSSIDVEITDLLRHNRPYPTEERATRQIANDWADFRRLWAVQRITDGHGPARAQEADELESALQAVTSYADELARLEGVRATALHAEARHASSESMRLLVLILALGLIGSVGVVLWLIRSVRPRTLAYSRFASRIAKGDFRQRLPSRGTDELAQLGRTLDDVARHRQVEADYDRTQLEYTDMLQVTGDEQEAHELLIRHLERSIPRSVVTVLNRNNSNDRLESAAQVPDGSPLLGSLEGAVPRACLAVRMAQPHDVDPAAPSLLSCSICAVCEGTSSCTPLLVGGEVIGSVLVNHGEPPDEDSRRRIRESVRQAAPVLANLRNLAVAEFRAANDPLTGLPNRRAIDDTVKRMVAQAWRTKSSLAALMLDLDHFKQVNDQFGHGQGDEVLAAVGAALRGIVRESDFAGRYGGEEFLLLLPATDLSGARTLAEKIRRTIREIVVPSVGRPMSVSIGLAVLPDHAVDAATLEQAADRALYVAKSNGRDRVEVAIAAGDATADADADALPIGD